MEKSFDFGALLKNHEKKHKSKPTQYVSVAGGVKKRLENNIKYRKSSRLTIFDSIRNLQKCESPAPLSNAQQKVEHRRQQLERWKEDKEKRKKEAAAVKKKPFIAGVPHAPLKFVPPPPPPKAIPSTSGRVTRSQSTRNSTKQKLDVQVTSETLSFAPKNASFRPPQNLAKAPSLVVLQSKKDIKSNFMTFEPIASKNIQKTNKQNVKETKPISVKSSHVMTERTTRSKQNNNRVINGKVTKPVQKPKHLSDLSESSSSSELEQPAIQSPILTSKNTRKSMPLTNSPKKNKTPRKSISHISEEYTPKRTVPKSESSSEEKLRSPKNIEAPMTPEQIADAAKKISPCVTMSRGKDNARREMKQKMEQGLLDEDASDMDSLDHFRKQLASEIKRMTAMCDTWDKILEQTQLPDAVQEGVLAALGQARLLMSQKLAQFASLVERCAQPDPAASLVTPADLHGFWDMVFMQVENVDLRFKKLEDLRARGWVDEQPVEVKQKVVKNVVKKPKPMGGPSRLREMIAAARKAKKEQESQATEPVVELQSDGDKKTFEAGFFCVRSPVRSPATTATPTRTLLKSVLSSEAKKASASKSSASFAMLRASVLGKNVEYDGIALLPQTPLNPINLQATPGRSILKSANIENVKSGKKSIKMVLFDQSDNDIQNSSISQIDLGSNTFDSESNKDLQSNTHRINKNLETEVNTDSGLSSMDIEKETEKELDTEKDKENSRRKPKLIRQDATADCSPVMTRSRRKSRQNTPQLDLAKNEEDKSSKRSGRKKKVLQEEEDNSVEKLTPKRSSRRRKSALQEVVA